MRRRRARNAFERFALASGAAVAAAPTPPPEHDNVIVLSGGNVRTASADTVIVSSQGGT